MRIVIMDDGSVKASSNGRIVLIEHAKSGESLAYNKEL